MYLYTTGKNIVYKFQTVVGFDLKFNGFFAKKEKYTEHQW